MEKIGWVKIYRQLIDSRVFLNEGLLKVWIWCLLKANHQKRWVPIETGKGTTEVEIQPGQFIFGRNRAASELRMKPSTVADRIKKLKNMKNIDIQPDNHYSIISIVNWDVYQADDAYARQPIQQATNRQPTGNQQATNINKNEDNFKNEKELNINCAKNCACEICFNRFWDLYNKKRDRKKCFQKWKRLKQDERDKIFETLPAYIESTKDVQFRKDPSTYLNNQSWNNEIVKGKSNGSKQNFSDPGYYEKPSTDGKYNPIF